MQALEELFPLYVKHVLRPRLHEHESSPYRNISLIHASGPASIYWSHEPESWDWHTDLGVIAPLADSMWIEAKPDIPMTRLRQDLTEEAVSRIEAQRASQRLSRVTDEGDARKVAIRLQAVQRTNIEPLPWWQPEIKQQWHDFYDVDAKWVYEIEVYVETDRGFSSSIADTITVLVDAQGHFIKVGTENSWSTAPKPLATYVERTDHTAGAVDLKPFLADASFFALYALSLANAKNIGVVDEGAKIQSKRLKKAIPYADGVPTTFSRINLNAVSVPSDSSGGSGRTSRMHFVRGHFKTYTEDSKLMGKHTGTYYWGHHARGDQKAGAVDQVYEV